MNEYQLSIKDCQVSRRILTEKIIKLLKEVISDNCIKQLEDFKKMYSKNIFSKNMNLLNPLLNCNTEITIDYYIKKIVYELNLECSSIIITLIYLDRFCILNHVVLNESNFFKIFFCCVVLSHKFNEDDNYENTYYAIVGGLNLEFVNKIERIFFKAMKYKLYVGEKEFLDYSKFFKISDDSRSRRLKQNEFQQSHKKTRSQNQNQYSKYSIQSHNSTSACLTFENN